MTNKKSNVRKIDAVDYEIIKILKNDVRIPISAIAKSLNIDLRTAKKRVDALIKNNIISFATIINNDKIGYAVHVIFMLSVDREKFDQTVKSIKKHCHLDFLAKGFGECNMIFSARFRNNEDMSEFIEVVLPDIEDVSIQNYCLTTKILLDHSDSSEDLADLMEVEL